MKFSLIFFSMLMLSTLSSQAQFPQFPTRDVTRTQDRDQMLWQLGISFPVLPSKLKDPNAPKGAQPADPNNPEGNWKDSANHLITRSGFGLWNNYKEANVGVYTPIDLLKMKDGTPITSEDQWWAKRRPEIVKDVQKQVWGVMPPKEFLPSVTFTTTSKAGGGGETAYLEKTINGVIDVSQYPQVRDVPKIVATLRLPVNASGPVPVMVVIGHPRWTSMDTYWGYCSPQGWGVCIFDCGALQPDNGQYLTSYLIGLCNQGNWRKPTDWGSLVAWAWGVGKLIDYFETDPAVDAKKIGVTGHSRFGKATIVTMAYEPRVAIAFPSCGGGLGTKMNRRHLAQDVENISWDQEYHWMAGNFFKWMGPLKEGSYLPRKVELMPVDGHSLLSLCAPRPVFLNGGTNDTWTDSYGIFLVGKGATPVYELLGKKGLISFDEKPKVDVGYIVGDIGYRYHEGGHTDAPDWPEFFKFASKYISSPGKAVVKK